MAFLDFFHDVTGARGQVKGSDNRLNTSSRSDGRRYYNSRDKGQSYSMDWTMTNAISTEDVAYLKNTSTSLTMVISSVGLNSELATSFKLKFVTGTAAGSGATVPVPANLNASSNNDAAATTLVGAAAATGITGLSDVATIDFARCPALGHEEFRLADTVRLGQNDAIAIEAFLTAGGAESDVDGIIFFYYE